MSEGQKLTIGSIIWQDLTVPDAAAVRDFYTSVVGWQATNHDMGGYADFDIHPAQSEQVVAGICHAQGVNAALPPVWLIYIVVANVEESARKCVELGGKLLDGPRMMGEHTFCVIQDPAGAIAGLISQ